MGAAAKLFSISLYKILLKFFYNQFTGQNDQFQISLGPKATENSYDEKGRLFIFPNSFSTQLMVSNIAERIIIIYI